MFGSGEGVLGMFGVFRECSVCFRVPPRCDRRARGEQMRELQGQNVEFVPVIRDHYYMIGKSEDPIYFPALASRPGSLV